MGIPSIHRSLLMDPHSAKDPTIEQLAEEFLMRQRQGLSPTVETYAAAYPHLADQIRDLFPTMMLLENWKTATPVKTSRPAADFPRPQLADFQIVREIGRGGMGIVYEAIQQSLERRIALKVLPHQVFFNNKKLDRFRREARAAGALNHPNIVTVHSVGQQKGLHYIVMRLVEGVGLDVLTALIARNLGMRSDHSLMGQGDPLANGLAAALMSGDFKQTARQSGLFQREIVGPAMQHDSYSTKATVAVTGTDTNGDIFSEDLLPADLGRRDEIPQNTLRLLSEMGDTYWQSVAKVIRQAAVALGHAHRSGTLHRDIKPANLLLDRFGTMWVTDFGLAKALQQDDVSGSGELVGTIRYMAPEQIRGATDTRSDLYSLGLTLYELTCFCPAFRARSPRELVAQITQNPPPAPRTINASVPPSLETIVLKAIAKSPEKRYQTGEAFAEALQHFVEPRPLVTIPTTRDQERNNSHRNTAWLWVGMLSIIATITIGVVVFQQRSVTVENASPAFAPGDQTISMPPSFTLEFDEVRKDISIPPNRLSPSGRERPQRPRPIFPPGHRPAPRRPWEPHDHRPRRPAHRPIHADDTSREFVPPLPARGQDFRRPEDFPRDRRRGRALRPNDAFPQPGHPAPEK